MKYSNGLEVRLDDYVGYFNEKGTIVVCVDSDEYSEDYPKEVWADYLGRGALILLESGARVQVDDYEKHPIVLIKRRDIDI